MWSVDDPFSIVWTPLKEILLECGLHKDESLRVNFTDRLRKAIRERLIVVLRKPHFAAIHTREVIRPEEPGGFRLSRYPRRRRAAKCSRGLPAKRAPASDSTTADRGDEVSDPSPTRRLPAGTPRPEE